MSTPDLKAVLCALLVAPSLVGQHIVGDHRSTTSRRRQAVRWQASVPRGESTRDFEAVIREVRKGDPRPLLILRDDDRTARLVRELTPFQRDNETVLLLTHWFHCVKVGRRVLEKTHPWHSLFKGREDKSLLLVAADGRTVISVRTTRPKATFQAAMLRMLRLEYQKDAAVAVKSWLRILDTFDKLEPRMSDLEQREFEKHEKGDKTRAKRHATKLARLRKQYEQLTRREAALMQLVLRKAPKRKTVADFDDEAAAEVHAGDAGLLKRVRGKKQGEKGKK